MTWMSVCDQYTLQAKWIERNVMSQHKCICLLLNVNTTKVNTYLPSNEAINHSTKIIQAQLTNYAETVLQMTTAIINCYLHNDPSIQAKKNNHMGIGPVNKKGVPTYPNPRPTASFCIWWWWWWGGGGGGTALSWRNMMLCSSSSICFWCRLGCTLSHIA